MLTGSVERSVRIEYARFFFSLSFLLEPNLSLLL